MLAPQAPLRRRPHARTDASRSPLCHACAVTATGSHGQCRGRRQARTLSRPQRRRSRMAGPTTAPTHHPTPAPTPRPTQARHDTRTARRQHRRRRPHLLGRRTRRAPPLTASLTPHQHHRGHPQRLGPTPAPTPGQTPDTRRIGPDAGTGIGPDAPSPAADLTTIANLQSLGRTPGAPAPPTLGRAPFDARTICARPSADARTDDTGRRRQDRRRARRSDASPIRPAAASDVRLHQAHGDIRPDADGRTRLQPARRTDGRRPRHHARADASASSTPGPTPASTPWHPRRAAPTPGRRYCCLRRRRRHDVRLRWPWWGRHVSASKWTPAPRPMSPPQQSAPQLRPSADGGPCSYSPTTTGVYQLVGRLVVASLHCSPTTSLGLLVVACQLVLATRRFTLAACTWSHTTLRQPPSGRRCNRRELP